MSKTVRTYRLKQKTLEMLQEISDKEDDTLSNTIDKAVEYYAKDKYGL